MLVIKKIVNAILTFSILSMTLNASASASVRPYMGADAQKRQMFFEYGYGHNLFKHRHPQTNFYAGVLFNKFFGIELGYYKTIRLDSQVALKPGDNTLGYRLKLQDNYTVLVQSKLKGKHANFVFLLPISDRANVDFIVTVGLSKLKLILSKDISIDRGAPNIYLSEDHQDFIKTLWVPRINLGFQKAITQRFSVRFLAGWEGTRKFNNLRPIQQPSPAVAKTKNSTLYSLGLVYHFR